MQQGAAASKGSSMMAWAGGAHIVMMESEPVSTGCECSRASFISTQGQIAGLTVPNTTSPRALDMA